MSSNNNTTRMGDIFQQRRGMASSSNHSQNSWSGGVGGGSSRSSSRQQHRGRRGGGGRSSNTAGSNRQQQQQEQAYYNSLPLEQGVICSLKESFGFIHCADRPEEVFFHYSQLSGSSNMRVEDLEMDMEVEFRVGTSFNSKKNDDNLAAFCVRPLQPGTIVWETVEQEHATGIVENRITPRQDGRIRVLEEAAAATTTANHDDDKEQEQQQQQEEVQPEVAAANEKDETTTTTTTATATATTTTTTTKKTPAARATGPLVKFGPNDYNPETAAASRSGGSSSSSSNKNDKSPPPRLAKGDLVAFTLVRDRRTQELWARNIHLLLSERERARQEAEARLLAEASLEHGVITALKGEYGFLRSNKRREEVYFHYSDIHLDDDDDDDDEDDGHGDHDGDHEEHSKNEPNGKRTTRSSSNEMVLREGQDMQFLVVTEGGEEGRPQVRVSARRVKMRPRGSVKFHDVVATGMTGLVSIVPQPQDSGHALDTKGKVLLATPLKDVDEEGNEKVVTEVYLSSKDSPGGSFAFRGGSSVGLWIEVGDTLLFDVVRDYADGAFRAVPTRHQMPSEDPTDISMVDDDDEEDDKKKGANERRVRLIGLSLAHRAEGIVNAVKDAYGFVHFAERPVDAHFKLFQLLPDDIQKDLRRNMGLADVDDKGNPLQLVVGAEAQFDLSVHGSIQSHSTRHRGRQASHPHERENLKAQRVLLIPPNTIRQIFPLAKGIRGCVTKDNPKQPYSGSIDLDEAVKTITPEERHPLVAKMIDDFMARNHDLPLVYHDVQSLKEDDTVIEMIERRGKGQLSWIHIPQPGETHYPGRLCIRKDPTKVEKLKDRETKSDDEGLDIEIELHDEMHETMSDEGGGGGSGGKRGHRHKKPKDTKIVKTVRFDKSNLCKELKEDMPPGVGDIVEFDLSQSRRTGQCIVENMRIVTRKEPKSEDMEGSSGFGIVKDVVAARKFGFISVIDETAQNLEMLFFNLSNVVPPPPESNDGTPQKKKPQIRKGDEVKFNIGTERSGKRVALDVTILPKGTIPSTADKNACTGFILMEPSHTSLKKATLRQTKSNISQSSSISQSSVQSSERSGRWGSVDEDRICSANEDQLAEDGCILLLEDPTGMFDSKKNGSESGDSAPESELEGPTKTFLHRHLNYKNGAIAVHGSGSSSATDEKTRPRRGDKVSFTKTKKGGYSVRDIRIVERDAATLLRGRLEGIATNGSGGRARFVAATECEEAYEVSLTEVVSCDPSVLKEKELVEGILYDGSIYGICRASDLYLESKVATKRKERPKLNLTVKKDRGGTIMAQSMMAKGPDEGTHGFAPGWTKRMSAYAKPFTPESVGK